ncbi:MAG TPA: hypothetical protein VK395_37105 [Gemmataceae bacterium]|nr:hypothetical protein [Gemmataceae bacterium]
MRKVQGPFKTVLMQKLQGVLYIALCLGVGAGIAYFARGMWQKKQEDKLQSEFGPASAAEMQRALSRGSSALPKQEHWAASCTAGNTTLTLDLTNLGKFSLTNVRYTRLVLEAITPEESLPVQIAEIKPSETAHLAFHFKNVPWERLCEVKNVYKASLDVDMSCANSQGITSEKLKDVPVTLDLASVKKLEEARLKTTTK